jgi:SAM-dependent methyltransferase
MDQERIMSESPAPNAAQVDYWNTTAGVVWAQFQEQLDRQIEPLGLEAMRVLAPAPGERVIDIGCGCGQTTAELAARVGRTGSVVGVDISEPMLAVSRQRPLARAAARPSFRLADVQTGDLGAAEFDAAFSRFGVMFFADPVAAFANIRKALKPGGRLGFVCWRPLRDNPWMLAPMEAALPFLPPLPPTDPTAPGPFAFADPDRVRAILAGAGFSAVEIEPFDDRIGGSEVEQTMTLIFRIGPLGAALREHPQCAAAAAGAVRSKILEFETPDGVLMPAAVWIVHARND